MRNKLIATAITSLLISTSAYAADAIIYQDPAPVAPVSHQFDWTGFYLGVNGGYVWTRGSDAGTTRHFDGGVLGAHAGYNVQQGNLVFGVEGDIGYTWNRRSWDVNPVPPPVVTATVGTEWQGSIRARVGAAFDRTLVYGTGGVAFTNGFGTLDVGGVSVTERKTLTGWTIGAGLEHAFTDNWTARAEYRYSDYGRIDLSGIGGGNPRVTEHTIRAGISYKF